MKNNEIANYVLFSEPTMNISLILCATYRDCSTFGGHWASSESDVIEMHNECEYSGAKNTQHQHMK